MSDSEILNRFAGRVGELAGRLGKESEETAEDLGCFGWLRGIRDRALMLELRKKEGHILAIGYGWLEKAEFDPSVGITLYLGEQRIRIKGRNLNAEPRPGVHLFQGIARHVVPWIREASRAESIIGKGANCVVEAIEW